MDNKPKIKTPSLLPVIIIAVIATGLTLFFLSSLRADTNIVVAARPIAIGARLTEADVKLIAIRSKDALPNSLTKVEDAIGQVISAQRLSGDQISKDMLGSQAISAIASALKPDHRAVAVTVTRSGGLAGILRPGDNVTLIGVIEPESSANALASPFQLTPTAVETLPTPAGVALATTPTESPVKPVTPFSRITATGLKVLLVPQSFRYQEVTATDSQGFAQAQTSQVGQSSGVIVLDVPATPVTITGASGPLTLSLPELIALLDSNAKIYLALEPPSSVKTLAPGIAIEQLVDFGVGRLLP
jgi:Flp pilus assembly protein CpaB